MLKKIIANTFGLTAAFVLTAGTVYASGDYQVKDCPNNPEYTVQCDKIVFHPVEKKLFYCPVQTVAPAQPWETDHGEIIFRHTDLMDIRIQDESGMVNDVRAITATYLNERGCVRSRPFPGFGIRPEDIVIEHIGFTSVAPAPPLSLYPTP